MNCSFGSREGIVENKRKELGNRGFPGNVAGPAGVSVHRFVVKSSDA